MFSLYRPILGRVRTLQTRQIWNWKIGYLLKPEPRHGTEAHKRYWKGMRKIFAAIFTGFGLLMYFDPLKKRNFNVIKDFFTEKHAKEAEEKEKEFDQMVKIAEEANKPIKIEKLPEWPPSWTQK